MLKPFFRILKKKWVRRILKTLLICAILLIVMLPAVYMFRWKLFGGIIRVRTERALGRILHGSATVESMSGSILSDIEFRSIRVKPLARSYLTETAYAGRISVEYSLWRLLTGSSIPVTKLEAEGLQCSFREPEYSRSENRNLTVKTVMNILDRVLNMFSVDVHNARIACGRFKTDSISLHFTVSRRNSRPGAMLDLSGSGFEFKDIRGESVSIRTHVEKEKQNAYRVSGNVRVKEGTVETETDFDLPVAHIGSSHRGLITGYAALNDISVIESFVKIPAELEDLRNIWNRATADFEIKGDISKNVSGSLRASLVRKVSGQQKKNDTINISYNNNSFTVEPVSIPLPFGLLECEGTLGLDRDLRAPGPKPTSSGLTAVLSGTVRDLERHIPETAGAMIPEGRYELNALVRGTVMHPQLSLYATVSDLLCRLPAPLVQLEGFSVKAHLEGPDIIADSFCGYLGNRLFTGSGRISLDPPHDLEFRLKGDNLLLLNADDGSMRMRLDADLELSGSTQQMKLTGNMGIPMFQNYGEFVDADVNEGQKNVEDLGSIIAGLGVDMPPAPEGGISIPAVDGMDNISLNISVTSNGDIRLQNSVFGVKLKGAGAIEGTASQMAVSGDFNAVSGEVRLFPGLFLPVNVFKLTIPDKVGVEPSIRFESTLPVGNVRVFIQVTGPMASPNLQLTSDPPYPYEDLAKLIIYGHIPGQSAEGGMQAFILQAGKLFGGVAFDHMPRVEPEESFFSRFILGFESGDPRFEAEEILQRSAGGGGVYAEYMINKRMSLITEQDRSGNVAGFLEYTFRWPGPDNEPEKPEQEDTAPGRTAMENGLQGSSVAFAGNKAFTDEQLMKVIGPDIPRTSTWDAAAMSDAQFRLAHFYRESGHYYAKISTVLTQEGRPLFRIHEGPFVRMGKASFKGNNRISDEELRQTLFTERPSLLKTPFSNRLIDAQTRSLQEYYREMGYLEAVVRMSAPEYDEDGKRMNVTYLIKEGNRFLLEAVTWNTEFRRDIKKLIIMVQGHIGKPLRASLPETIASNVRTFYKNRGRPAVQAQASLHLDRKKHTGSITLNLKPGPRIIVENVKINGNKKVRTRFIEKIFDIDQGSPMKSGRIRNAERRLADTGLFSKVWTVPLDIDRFLADKHADFSDTFRVPLLLETREVQPHELKIRFGYSQYEKAVAGIEIGTRNAFGRGESLSLGITAGTRGYRADGDAQFYPVPGYPARAGLHCFYEDRDEISYRLRHAGISPLLSFDINRHEKITAGILFEWIKTDDIILGIPQEDLASFRIGAPFIAYTKDRRNSSLIPKRGYRLTARVEIADSETYGDISFWRATAGYQKYFPVDRDVTFAGSVRAGVISPFGLTEEIPLALRFFAGGVSSVRGFEERELGPQAGAEAVGGEVFGSFQAELRFRFIEDLHGSLFYDAGNVYATADTADHKDLRSGTGIGLRYYTPAGAVRFDTAWNTAPQPEEENVTYYFTIGMYF